MSSKPGQLFRLDPDQGEEGQLEDYTAVRGKKADPDAGESEEGSSDNSSRSLQL